jgi:hypothetical protein
MSPSDSIVNALREAGVHRIVSGQDAPQLGSMLNLVAAPRCITTRICADARRRC